jgi:hypothetical protein
MATLPIPPVALVTPTCGRPQLLARALHSYAANITSNGDMCEMVIGDNSPTAEIARQNAAVVAEIGAHYGLPVIHAGAAAKADLADAISKQGIEADVIRFALTDAADSRLPHVGANYNYLMLRTAGSHMIAVDDDTICNTTSLPDADPSMLAAEEEVQLSSCWPAQLRTCDDVDAERNSLPAQQGSYLQAHRAGFAAARGVRVTLPGLLGDCGWASPSFYLMLSGASLNKFVSDEDQYRRGCRRRTVIRAVGRGTLTSRNSNMLCMFFGVDNTSAPPPFLPVSRGCDRLYGLTVSACAPDECFSHLTTIVEHHPGEARAFWPGEIMRSASGIDLAYAIGALISDWAPAVAGQGRLDRMAALGRHLESVAGLHTSEFSAAVLRAVRGELATVANTLRMRASAYQLSAPWFHADVTQFLAILMAAAATPGFACPLDLRIGRTPKEGLELLREITAQYGRLLRAWPQMWRVAAEMRRQVANGGLLNG